MAGEQGRGFYVNEDLTKTRFDMFRYSRKLLKDHLINGQRMEMFLLRTSKQKCMFSRNWKR